MLTRRGVGLVVIALVLMSQISVAQPRPDPLNPEIRLAPQPRVSPFADYQRYADDKPRSWREVNDEVMKIGGHAGHIKDGPSVPDAAQSSSPGNRPQQAPDAPHRAAPAGGHSQHRH